MKHPPSTDAIEVDLHHVLWFTRGRGWDYTFLLWPLLPRIADWDDLRAQIFDTMRPGFEAHSISGSVEDFRSQRGFLATTFLDPVRRDGGGLPVIHHLVWFPPDGLSRAVAPVDWGPQLVAAMREPYDAVFPTVMTSFLDLDPHDGIRGLFTAALARLVPRVRVEGTAVMVCVMPAIRVDVELARRRAPWRRQHPRLVALLLWLGVAMGLWLAGTIVR